MEINGNIETSTLFRVILKMKTSCPLPTDIKPKIKLKTTTLNKN